MDTNVDNTSDVVMMAGGPSSSDGRTPSGYAEAPALRNSAPAVRVEGAVGENVLTPGLAREVVPGRAVVVHEDCRVVNTAVFADTPFRRAGSVTLGTLQDFVAYVKARMTPAVRVFVGKHFVRAVFNADSWWDDVADFDVECTQEWRRWNGGSEKWSSQPDFCDFLEDEARVIVEPCGADLLQLVTDFRMLQKVEFGASYRGADGQMCVSYTEKNSGVGRDLALPGEFKLHLPVLKGAEKMTTYEVVARLRTRVDKESHKLSLQYRLVRPDVPMDNAVADVAGWLREQLPGGEVYVGKLDKSPRVALMVD